MQRGSLIEQKEITVCQERCTGRCSSLFSSLISPLVDAVHLRHISGANEQGILQGPRVSLHISRPGRTVERDLGLGLRTDYRHPRAHSVPSALQKQYHQL